MKISSVSIFFIFYIGSEIYIYYILLYILLLIVLQKMENRMSLSLIIVEIQCSINQNGTQCTSYKLSTNLNITNHNKYSFSCSRTSSVCMESLFLRFLFYDKMKIIKCYRKIVNILQS